LHNLISSINIYPIATLNALSNWNLYKNSAYNHKRVLTLNSLFLSSTDFLLFVYFLFVCVDDQMDLYIFVLSCVMNCFLCFLLKVSHTQIHLKNALFCCCLSFHENFFLQRNSYFLCEKLHKNYAQAIFNPKMSRKTFFYSLLS
jgi:hypothetical protein